MAAGIPGYSSNGVYAHQLEQYPNPYAHLRTESLGTPKGGTEVLQQPPETIPTDEDFASEAESTSSDHSPVFTRAHGLICVGLLLVVSVTASPLLLLFGPRMGGLAAPSNSIQELFRSQEIAQAAADNVVIARATTSGRRLEESMSRDEIYALVVSGFKSIDEHIQVNFPDVHRGLCQAQLSPPQREAIVNAMRHIADPRVQNLGRSLLQAAGTNEDSLMLKVTVLKHVQSFFREVQTLRDEIIPASLRQRPDGLVDPDDVDQMKLLRSFKSWYARTHPEQEQQQVERRLGRIPLPIPGTLSYQKQPLTWSGQGLTLGPLASELVSYISGQAVAFFHQIGQYFSYLGLDKMVDNIFGGQNWKDFTNCAKEHMSRVDISAEARCFTTFADFAFDEMMHTNLSRMVKDNHHKFVKALKPTVHAMTTLAPMGPPTWWGRSTR